MQISVRVQQAVCYVPAIDKLVQRERFLIGSEEPQVASLKSHQQDCSAESSTTDSNTWGDIIVGGGCFFELALQREIGQHSCSLQNCPATAWT